MNIVTFSDFMKFLREEAELVNDLIFSPDALKAVRKKTDAHTRLGWRGRQNKESEGRASADSFATTTIQLQNSSVLPSKTSADQVNQARPLCNGQHALVKCSKFLKSSVDERSEIMFQMFQIWSRVFGMSEPIYL